MTFNIGAERNTSTEVSTIGPVITNATTAVTLFPANPNRVYMVVMNMDSSKRVWVKLQAAAIDNMKNGIIITGTNFAGKPFTLQAPNIYTGEVSVIADAGTPSVYAVEF
jgi:exosome complex RNA-binding protein Rrp4